MPRYDLEEVRRCVEADAFAVVNTRARQNLQELGWEIEKLKRFLLCLDGRHFRKTRNDLRAYNGRKTLSADCYKRRFDEAKLCEGGTLFFYVELALDTVPSGETLAVISIHLDGQP